jgi:L-ribulokinase
MKISASGQTCALGAAIFGAVAGGVYPSTEAAQARMTGVKPTVFEPIAARVAVYAELFELYARLHDAFGGVDRAADLSGVMKKLIEIRERVRKG